MTRPPLKGLLLASALASCTAATSPDHSRQSGSERVEPAAMADEAAGVALGLSIAESACARCHAISDDAPSGHAAAPPFPRLARRLPPDALLPYLEEGIRATHPDMPEIRLAPAEIDPFLAFWATL